MRDYAKIEPKAWQGDTFKKLRRRGIEGASEGLLMALYLMSSPSSNMLGLYCQPLLYAAHETGMTPEGASKGLQACIDAGFCAYDFDTETVWVFEMAAYQIADSLSSGDKRCKGIQKDYERLPENPFLGEFFDKYAAAFHLTSRRGNPVDNKAPSKPLTKPLRSQEQEQEQEQEREKTLSGNESPAPITPPLADPPPPPAGKHPTATPNGLHKRQAIEILDFLNAKTGHGYKPVPANVDLIVARLKEGFEAQDVKSVIAMKAREWKDDDAMRQYLRPATLFNRTNFAQYHGQLVQLPNPQQALEV